MQPNERIAIVRLSSVGDVLHCTPVARAIKKAAPSCRITWIVGSVSADVLAGNRYIDEVYIWSREHWEKLMRNYRFGEALAYWQKLRDDLDERSFDTAIDIHGIFISGLVMLATGAKRKIGLQNTRELNSLFVTEKASRPPEGPHVIQRYLSVLNNLQVTPDGYNMDLMLTQDAAQFADTLLANLGYDSSRPMVALSPKTTWATKNWPPEYFAAAARSLSPHAQLLLCGGPGDTATAEEIIRQAKVPFINTVGKTRLHELAALLARSDVLLTGDTGPLHMAVALGIPTVSVFGPTSPAVYGPLTSGHTVLQSVLDCGPCNKQRCRLEKLRCLRDVAPETAVAAIKNVLAQRKTGCR